MDWNIVIPAALSVIFGGGWLTTVLTAKSQQKKARAEADASVIGNYEKGINEWQDLYKEQRTRNQELESKIEALSQENNELRLANQRLKIEIDKNSEDIRELKEIIKSLRQRKTAKAKSNGNDK
jgi:hypothetical protein